MIRKRIFGKGAQEKTGVIELIRNVKVEERVGCSRELELDF